MCFLFIKGSLIKMKFKLEKEIVLLKIIKKIMMKTRKAKRDKFLTKVDFSYYSECNFQINIHFALE